MLPQKWLIQGNPYLMSKHLSKHQKCINGKARRKFERERGQGKVFVIFSVEKERKKDIYNKEVIKEIEDEIQRLKHK